MQEEIIANLRHFISFRTVAGANDVKRECLEWIRDTFLASGKVVMGDIDSSPYLYLPHPAPKLLWFAHIDVVPAEDHQFELKREGDRLIGRGTSDMKGNQLPFLMAYRDAIAEGKDPPVSILLTSDEETAGQTIPTLLKEKVLWNVPVAFTPDCGLKIVCEHKGVLWADLICEGQGAHAAYPWNGKNPLTLLAEALHIIEEEFPKGSGDDWQMTVTPTEIKGGTAKNQIPSTASCTLDIRFPSEIAKTPEKALEIVADELPEGCDLRIHIAASPLHTDPKHPMVQLVRKIAEEVTGEKVEIRREHGGTDARYFGEKGIPAFLYGVDGGGIHGKDEWVSLQSLLKNYEISKQLL